MILAATPTPSWAAGGACPAAYDSDDADPGIGYNVCTGTTAINCEITGASSTVNMTAVRGFGGDPDVYSVWGEYGTTKFCWSTDRSGISDLGTIKLKGGSAVDTLKANTVVAFTTYNLSSRDGDLDLEIWGYANNDTLRGSDELGGSGNTERLYGGDDNDTLNAGGGDDELYGGNGDDTMLGGGGEDWMEGGDGDDTMTGGAGIDTTFGEDGLDAMSGGESDDIMDGGADTDVLCGGTGDDTLDDGDSVLGIVGDKLWGATSGDEVTCGHVSTRVDANSGQSGTCSGTYLTSMPAECP